MKRSNRLVIFVGVLLAILAFVGIVVLLNNSNNGGNAGSSQAPTTVAVLVAKADIAIGDAVTPDMVEVRQVDPSAVLGTRLSDPSQTGGRPALVAVPAGSQVNDETFGAQGVTCLSCMLQAGEVAIPIQVDQITGLDYLVQEGDHVDVLVSIQLPAAMNPEGGSLRSVKVVLQNKRVLFVSDRNAVTLPAATPVPGEAGAATPAPQTPTSAVVIIAGTDQDAEIMRYAARDQTEFQGTSTSAVVALTVRATGDDAAFTTTGITINQLIAKYGLLVPAGFALPSSNP